MYNIIFFVFQHHALQRLQDEEMQKLHEMNHPKQSFCYLKTYWSFEYWLLISIGSLLISMAFFVLWLITNWSTGYKKGNENETFEIYLSPNILWKVKIT